MTRRGQSVRKLRLRVAAAYHTWAKQGCVMFNHEPDDYVCPFCRLVAGGEDECRTQRDVVRRDELAMAFISPRWWPNNHGHVLVVPNAHYENLYDLPSRY